MVYFISRSIYLLHAPLYNDEAIYLRWIQEFIGDPHANWLISLSDGKQPLYVWVVSPFLFFIHSPLLAGRIASIIFGALTMLGLICLGYKITQDKMSAFFCGLFYVFFLPSFIYDRTAIYESLLGCLSIWTLFSTINFFQKPRLKNIFILAIFLSLGLLTKTSFIFLFYLLPLGVIIYNYESIFSKKTFFTVLFLGVAVLLGFLSYLPILHALNYQIILGKNATFIYPLHDWIHISLLMKIHNFTKNFLILFLYFFSYMQIFFIIPAIFSFSKKTYIKEKILLFSYFFIPFFALMVLGKSSNLAPRYIYFMILFLLPLCAIGLKNIFIIFDYFKKGTYALILCFFLFLYPAYSCFMLLVNPSSASIIFWDKKEYFNSRGTFISQTITYMKKESKGKDIVITTDGVLGLLPEAFQIAFNGNKNIFIKGYYPIRGILPTEISDFAKEKPTYFISFRNWRNNPKFPIHLMHTMVSTNHNDDLYVYKVD